MKKEKITINTNDFEFFFDDRLNMWRILENENIIRGYTLDIEIDLKNQNDEFELPQISLFLEYLHSNKEIMLENVNRAKVVLLALFQIIYKDTFDKEILDNIDFNFVGIDFKGYSQNHQGKFDYDFQFFPFYKNDPHKDIGTFLWKAFFRDRILLGVYSDIQ